MKLSSKSNYYTEKLIKYCFDYKPSVIEIHNRPSYLLKISKFFNETNFILVIHNRSAKSQEVPHQLKN